MPMEKDDLADMEKLIKKARQKPLPFGVCMGKKPENSVFFLHLKKPGEILARQAKKAGETAKVSHGTCEVNGKIVSLTCEGDILPGMARNMKQFFLKNDIKMKVEILDPEGNMLEADGDEDEGDTAADAAPADSAETQASEQSPDAPPDPAAAQWAKVVQALDPHATRFAAGSDPKAAAVQKAWDGAKAAANGGDYKSAMAVAAKIKPLITAAPAEAPADAPDDAPEDPNAKKWVAVHAAMEGLYAKAMANNPEDRSRLTAAWSMAQENAASGDFTKALAVATRLKPMLDAAIKAGAANQDIPKDVVPFQKSRILWIDTRRQMMSEMEKLQSAIVDVCGGDPELGEVVVKVKNLSQRLAVFDEQLETILDEITNTAEGDERTQLKKKAVQAIATYKGALDSDFFKAVDNENGFAKVNVASAASKSLTAIAKVLAA